MKRRIPVLLLSAFLAGLAATAGAAEPVTPRTPQNDPALAKRIDWWQDAKFGMFIHWGIYAVPAGTYKGKTVGYGEWIMDQAKIPIPEYEQFAKQFNPPKFNAREWVRLAKDAGMKYLVITSKHHDGFSMFDTDVNDYNIVDATPYRRDPMKDLAVECRRQGVKLGFYYSIMDWHHPDANAKGVDRYVPQMKAQLKELVTQYDPALLWFDGEWVDWWTQERGRDLEAYLRSLKPSLVINNRIGKRRMNDGDYETPEQEIPASAMGSGRLWETCMTINETWGYKKDDQNWKSTADLTRKLIDIASKGGNFLLNVGPTAEGIIPEPSVVRLREMGAWMRENGESIYGTTQSPYRRHHFDGRATVKGNTLYIHAFEWPKDGVTLPGMKTMPVAARGLESGKPVGMGVLDDGPDTYRIILGAKNPPTVNPLATVVAVRMKGKPAAEPVARVIRPDAEWRLVLRAADAEIQGSAARLQGSGENENIGYWTNEHDTVTWTVEYPKGRYRVEVDYACPPDSEGSMFSVVFPMSPNPNTGVRRNYALLGEVTSTGSWDSFQTHNMGVTELPGGRGTVRVQVEKMPKYAVMNLRQVRLIPVK